MPEICADRLAVRLSLSTIGDRLHASDVFSCHQLWRHVGISKSGSMPAISETGH